MFTVTSPFHDTLGDFSNRQEIKFLRKLIQITISFLMFGMDIFLDWCVNI